MSDRQSDIKFADVPIRTRSWGFIILIVSVALLHPILTCLFSAMLSSVAVREFVGLAYKNSTRKIDLLLILFALLETYVLYSYISNAFFLFTTVYVFTIVITLFMFYKEQRKATLKVYSIFIGLFFCIYSTGLFSYVRELYVSPHYFEGIKVLVVLFWLTELNDVFQYLVGKTIGKHKITPTISPNKTLEGFLGGVVLTTILANFLGYILFPNLGFLIYSLFGVSIGVLGFLGDIYMSSVKRRANVKDTSNLIPGHGGLLDRIDSLLFVTPVYYWAIVYLYFL